MEAPVDLREAIEKHKEQIMEEVNAVSITFVDDHEGPDWHPVTIQGETIYVKLTKVEE